MSALASPFFSVVIPTYNRAAFIGATLNSVLTQTFPHLEILVVDDGSHDNTAEVVGSYPDPRLRYYYKENAERGAARNYGLARAVGEYVIFLDSDDIFHPNHLSTLYAAIEAATPKPNFIATKYDFDCSGQHRHSDLAPFPAGLLGLDTFIAGNVLACNICLRRQNPALHLFEEDRQYAAVEDWMFMLQNTQHGDTVQLVDALTLTMNDHDQRSMRVDNQSLIQRLELAAGWMQQHLTLTPVQSRCLLGRLYYLCAIHAHIDGYATQARHFTRLALPGLTWCERLKLQLRTLLAPSAIQWLKRSIGR